MTTNILHHGGYIPSEGANRERRVGLEAINVETDFGYMFPNLARKQDAKLPEDDPEKVIAALTKLGAAMIDSPPEPPEANSRIPAIYTYFGQFIDHDITANTDRNRGNNDITIPRFHPRHPDSVVKEVKNLRRPAFDLDSVYGDGPQLDTNPNPEAKHFYNGVKLRVGKVGEDAPPGSQRIPDENDVDRDLPRIGALIDEGVAAAEDFPEDLRNTEEKLKTFPRVPWIGDTRNDENIIVAQLHLAFLRFHNKVVDWVDEHEQPGSDADRFNHAASLTRWHYQWLVINDFLRRITYPGVVDAVLYEGRRFYNPRGKPAYMPLEHSVAAYRFGHSMVRAVYDFNRNFSPVDFFLLFEFTGTGGFAGSGNVLPFNWPIEFDRFVDQSGRFPFRFARKIDTRLAPPLAEMTNQVTDLDEEDPVKAIMKHLAIRNLLRGYLLSIPTGQAVAGVVSADPLTEEELRRNNSAEVNAALEEGDFLKRTPLWYYILKEAEARADGETLGPVGSRIVAETFLGILHEDETSYENRGWTPEQGVRLPGDRVITTLKDLIEFAGLPVREQPLAVPQPAAPSA